VAVSLHLAATFALAAFFAKVGSIVGICGLVAVVFSAFSFGLKGGLLAALGQLLLNSTVMQLVIVPAVPIDGSSAVGVIFFFVAGAVVGNQRDLSRKLREQLATNERLRVREKETLSAIPDAMIRVDARGDCRLEPEAEPLPLEAAMAACIGRALPADKLLAIGEAISEVRAHASPRLLSLELAELTFYDVRCLPAADSSLLLVIRDMTEFRRLLRRLTSTENLASLGTLTAGLAHEVNNPLTYVISSVSSVVDSLRPGEAALRRELETALEGCWRIRDLVRDILGTTTGPQQELEAICVPDVIESALSLVGTLAHERASIQLRTEDVLYVQAHRANLMQVVVNLVANACQAFDARASGNEVVVSAFATGDSVVIEVQDNGCGMDEVTRKRALEPFFTTKPVGRGAGLGLFLCNSIVETLGGSLQIASEAGRGTKVSVRLRAAQEPPPQSGVVQLRGSLPPGQQVSVSLRVLVIDDEPEIRRSLRRLLGSKHQVDFSTNGAEALRLFVQGERYDVIISDLSMPEMNGIELFSELQQRFPDQAERVVFLTGGATSESSRLFLEAHRARVLHKPFCPVEIESTVRSFARVS
jgi:signal transduction histidine kinase/CheY-like chemotaxis protein